MTVTKLRVSADELRETRHVDCSIQTIEQEDLSATASAPDLSSMTKLA
jgi:hypothetical protein